MSKENNTLIIVEVLHGFKTDIQVNDKDVLPNCLSSVMKL